MLKVGITGGIGSGKSVVCRIFKLLGIPVYNADEAAKKLMQNDQSVKQQLTLALGNVYDSQGQLDRKKVAELIFHNHELLNAVNNIVHPAVIADYVEWEQQIKTPYCIRESAILFESGTNKDLDKIILVDAPEELRIERIMQRDHRTREEINLILQKQWSADKKKELSDYVIINDGQQALLPQVLNLHQHFMNVAKP